MAYLRFHKGRGKFLLATSDYTKGGQTMFSIFFPMAKFFPKGPWSNSPHKYATACIACIAQWNNSFVLCTNSFLVCQSKTDELLCSGVARKFGPQGQFLIFLAPLWRSLATGARSDCPLPSSRYANASMLQFLFHFTAIILANFRVEGSSMYRVQTYSQWLKWEATQGTPFPLEVVAFPPKIH